MAGITLTVSSSQDYPRQASPLFISPNLQGGQSKYSLTSCGLNNFLGIIPRNVFYHGTSILYTSHLPLGKHQEKCLSNNSASSRVQARAWGHSPPMAMNYQGHLTCNVSNPMGKHLPQPLTCKDRGNLWGRAKGELLSNHQSPCFVLHGQAFSQTLPPSCKEGFLLLLFKKNKKSTSEMDLLRIT